MPNKIFFMHTILVPISLSTKKIESVEQSGWQASYSVTIERDDTRFLLLQSLCKKKKKQQQPKKQKRKVKFYVGRRIEGGSLNWVLKKKSECIERSREKLEGNGDCDRSSSKKKKKKNGEFLRLSFSQLPYCIISDCIIIPLDKLYMQLYTPFQSAVSCHGSLYKCHFLS